MTASFVEIDILSALRFFDEAVLSSRYHATAVVAVAGEDMAVGLLSHYLSEQGCRVEVLPYRCTQGTKRGVRLDRWVRAIRSSEVNYYQVEIKNWSAHAIGGRVLDVGASSDKIEAHKIERWQKEWDGSTFRKKSVRKVLTPMKPPEPNIRVEPMVIYWDAMHPTGSRGPLFSVDIENPHFPRVWVFSVSAYFRELLASGIRKVEIEMPDTVNRLNWLNRLFKLP